MSTILETTLHQSKYNFSVKRLRIAPLFPNRLEKGIIFGFDPGTTKAGISYIWNSLVVINEIDAIRSPNPVARVLLTQQILSECCKMMEIPSWLIIEGSSFGNNYRQTELAEVRASAILWAIAHGIEPIVVPPKSIRKKVFGNGNTRAEYVWNDLPPNAASSLACAYYYLREKCGDQSNETENHSI